MPIHDWSRARAGRFHHFHNAWIYKLSDTLNASLLPAGFYAAGEQVMGEYDGAIAVEERPPQVQRVQAADDSAYVRKQDHVVIRSPEDDRVVAWIEIVSRGNKASRHEIDRFLRKTAAALDQGINLLIIDLQSPGSFDQQGLHATIWDYLFGVAPESVAGQPLTLVCINMTARPLTG